MKTIRIHSFPRSGTNYILLNLRKLLPGDSFAILKSPEEPFTLNKDITQIIVLRDPLESIISAVAHGETLNPGDGDMAGAFLYMSRRYVELIEDCHKYFDNIQFYFFDEIDDIPVKIASQFVNIPDNFVPDFPVKSHKHIPSMVDSEFYKNLINNIPDYSTYRDAQEAYASIVERIARSGLHSQ